MLSQTFLVVTIGNSEALCANIKRQVKLQVFSEKEFGSESLEESRSRFRLKSLTDQDKTFISKNLNKLF